MTEPAIRPLSSLRPGDTAVVHDVLASGRIRQRLLEMGFVRGARLRVAKLAPLGDPMELEIIYRYVSRIPEGDTERGYHLSLRRQESDCIRVTANGRE